ncbi:MAG: hypothetical protein EAZ32_09975 [Cytophagia bacterium]|nr:MAG: hypothetical protein EAZ46_05555 [Runella sp.]TAG20276.1 MAG: hypothetical protein EAZ38_10705 [Cytophagales bacterium]TAG39403.1 MAG: hypothetical protein EAZ32_09975 [Cytophagia bacterium]TAG80845.1 MAG: hypothetical protein EAZ22_08540 [Cytophagales bacterium]
MNKQEQFDKWVRHEVESLDNAPLDFDESAIWQKMQAELHSVSLVMPTKMRTLRASLVMLTKEASKIAACLLLLAGLWWQWPEAEKAPLAQNKISAVETTNAKPTSPLRDIFPRRELAQQPNEKPLLSGSPKRESTRPMLPPPHLTTAEIPTPETQKVADLPTISVENHLAEIKVPQTDNASLTLGLIQLTVSAEALSMAPKKKPKPQFKIVHANELVDYQRAELAEVREKEAQRNGFVVINWKQKGQESENNLMTYLRSKNNKTE